MYWSRNWIKCHLKLKSILSKARGKLKTAVDWWRHNFHSLRKTFAYFPSTGEQLSRLELDTNMENPWTLTRLPNAFDLISVLCICTFYPWFSVIFIADWRWMFRKCYTKMSFVGEKWKTNSKKCSNFYYTIHFF